MTNSIISRLFVPVTLAGILLLSGCGPVSTREKHAIVCIHSYDDSGQEGSYFREVMNSEFRKKKINAEITHIYLDLVSNEQPVRESEGGGSTFAKRVLAYKPEVLLVNDDLALEYIYNNCDTLFKTQPTVFAGTSAPRHWDKKEFPLLCGITDRVNLSTNCEVMNQVTGGHNAVVELDFGGYQDRLRRLLFENIRDTSRFINNAEFFLTDLRERDDNAEITNHMVVNFLSMEHPESNRMLGTSEDEGILISRLAKTSAPNSPQSQIQVKYDVFSNEIIESDRRPQFTCIREQFGSESPQNDKKVRTRFLCGFFASVETQIRDQVDYAVQIIEGVAPSSFPLLFHDQSLYMDWLAMKKCNPPLQYDDFSNKFTIINAPLRVRHQKAYFAGVGLIVALFLFLCIFINVTFLKKTKNRKREHLKRLQTEIDKRILALEDLETGFFMLKNRILTFYFGFAKKQGLPNDEIMIDELKWAVHPDSLPTIQSILKNPNGETRRSKIRIRLDFNGSGWRWWNLYFDTLSSDRNAIIGSIINIDDIANIEAQALDAAIKAEEVLSKESFIANITHDIRTPLNAITGFSELLLDPNLDQEDRMEFMEIISGNTEQMINLLEEAAVMQSDSTDSMSFKFRETNFSKLIDDSYKTNKILCPGHLSFIYKPAGRTDVRVRCDVVRTTQVINNFLSNAFKYTPSGSITFGWRMTENDTMAEVYVEDTGMGISEEDKKIIGSRFGMAKGNRKGTGLGLDICQKIIAAENGIYGFESELGKGSCFHFSLPVLNNKENNGEQ